MDLTGPAVHAEALVWRAVARISAAMATLPPEIPLAIRFCNQCDLFYCSHVADSGIPASIGIPAPPPRRPTTSCSHLCWSIDGVHADDGALSRGQVAALAALVSHAQFSVCDAAFCFGIPCSTAFQALFPDELVSTNPRPPPVHHRSSSNRTLSLDPAGFTSSDMQPRPVDLPYHRPCLCATQCTRPGFSCSCTAINHYCNALCSCPATCPRRWPGCKCHRHLATALADQQSTVSDPSSVVAPAVRAGQKRSRSAAATATVIPSPTVGLNGPMVAHMGPCCTDETVCPCAMAKRECGPACAPPAPEPGMADPYGGIAQNMCAQQRVRTAQDKFLDQIFVVQRSRAGDNGHDAGWGLFARTRILRGAFVGEYTGEILSDKEAERRGRAYDDMRFNFMFRLATNATVDGFWCGSLLRFANHGKRGVHANIEAEVVMIDGSQRISMTATRTIDAGQEILLDYGNEYFSFNNTPQKQSS
ncbi:hypothetical protein BC828DRAFT_216033 [Blastocladiella britannica]|nr:hypothetical protein BC828DRAFT_216033 [Blastocladiella britannica]